MRALSRGRSGYSRAAATSEIAAVSGEDLTGKNPKISDENEKKIRLEAIARRKALEAQAHALADAEEQRRQAALKERRDKLRSAQSLLGGRSHVKTRSGTASSAHTDHHDSSESNGGASTTQTALRYSPLTAASHGHIDELAGMGKPNPIVDQQMYKPIPLHGGEAIRLKPVATGLQRGSGSYDEAFTIDDDEVTSSRELRQPSVVERPVPAHIMNLLRGLPDTASVDAPSALGTSQTTPSRRSSRYDTPKAHDTLKAPASYVSHPTAATGAVAIKIPTLPHRAAKSEDGKNASAIDARTHLSSTATVLEHTAVVPLQSPQDNPLLSPARSHSPMVPGQLTPAGGVDHFLPPRPPQSHNWKQGPKVQVAPAGIDVAGGASVFSARSNRSRSSSASKLTSHPSQPSAPWGRGLHEALNADRRMADIRRREYELKVREEAAVRRLRARSKQTRALVTHDDGGGDQQHWDGAGPSQQGGDGSGTAHSTTVGIEDDLAKSLARLDEMLSKKPLPPSRKPVPIVNHRLPYAVSKAPPLPDPLPRAALELPGDPNDPAGPLNVLARSNFGNVKLYGRPWFREEGSDGSGGTLAQAPERPIVATVPVGAPLPTSLASVIAKTKALAIAAKERQSRPTAPSSESDEEHSDTEGNELDSTAKMLQSLRRSRGRHGAP